MTDKEVGKIWGYFYKEPNGLLCGYIVDLIRKLVEERADWRLKYSDVSREPIINIEEAIAATLSDFSIDPKTWK